jgi:hypothetical protein
LRTYSPHSFSNSSLKRELSSLNVAESKPEQARLGIKFVNRPRFSLTARQDARVSEVTYVAILKSKFYFRPALLHVNFSQMSITGSGSKITQLISAILLTLGIVGWFQEMFSVEWSSPYCSSQIDGPVSAVWGMPLPYIRWSTVFSMEYFWMPAVFVLNLALLFAVLYPLISFVVGRMDVRVVHLALLTVGAVLTLTFGFWIGLQIYTGMYKTPVSNIANENYESYTDLRPVHFGFKTLRYQCTPLK